MKKILFVIAVAIQTWSIFAQTATDSTTSPKVKLYGFIRADAYYNSRQMEESADGFTLIMPKPEKNDVYGNDLNGSDMTGLTATATRFGIDLQPFRLKGTNTILSGKIEGDFQGYSGSLTMLRIRHAYVNMAFKNSELLVGQYWHPLFFGAVPTVLDLNGGLPYQPFARHPQVKYTYKMKNFSLFAAAAYQTQFLSAGVSPDGKSIMKGMQFQKHSLLPDMIAGVEFYKKEKGLRLGIMGEYKEISPRTTAHLEINNETETVAVNEKLPSYAVAAYGSYTKNKFSIKAKGVYGQNLGDLMMIGGYAATKENAKGERTYKAFNVISAWLNADYHLGKNWLLTAFGGYSKNLGCDNKTLNATSAYGVLYDGQMLDHVWRSSAMLSYQLSAWWALSLEYSYNKAYYGQLDPEKGKAMNVDNGIDGSRILAVVQYSF
ncbi:MAG: hypothetical protein LBR81_01290 [Prevotellaceae bacterium]|nr:hypothetical protein [Prevotellaceae bacterium]